MRFTIYPNLIFLDQAEVVVKIQELVKDLDQDLEGEQDVQEIGKEGDQDRNPHPVLNVVVPGHPENQNRNHLGVVVDQ